MTLFSKIQQYTRRQIKKVKLYLYLIVELVVRGIAPTFARLLVKLLAVLFAPLIARQLVQLIAATLALDALILVGLIAKEVVSTVAEDVVDAAEVAEELVVLFAVDVQDAPDVVVVQEHVQQVVKNLVGSVLALVETCVQAVTVVQGVEDHAVEAAVVVAEVAEVAEELVLQAAVISVLQVVKVLAKKGALFNAHRNAQLTAKTAAQAIA